MIYLNHCKLHFTWTVAINFVVSHASKPVVSYASMQKKAKQNAVKQAGKGITLYFNESKYFKHLYFLK